MPKTGLFSSTTTGNYPKNLYHVSMEFQVKLDELCPIIQFKLQKNTLKNTKKVFETGSSLQ
jgi:hypothetical protein